MFTTPSAIKRAKLQFSISVVTEVSLFAYVIYFSADAAGSQKINNIAK